MPVLVAPVVTLVQTLVRARVAETRWSVFVASMGVIVIAISRREGSSVGAVGD